jgi:hypothetical protein
MKPSPRSVVFFLSTLIWLVIGWPFARRYHPIAEGVFNFVFVLGVIVLPTFLEWLERRNQHH